MKRVLVQQLESRLREEGRRETPSFSVPLHTRIIGALRAEGLPQAAPRPTQKSGSAIIWRIGIPLALAAGLALAAWIVLRPSPTVPQQHIVKTPPTAPRIELPEIQPADLPNDALEKAKYAYLDRDAMKLWTFVADQLPVLPDAPKKDH